MEGTQFVITIAGIIVFGISVWLAVCAIMVAGGEIFSKIPLLLLIPLTPTAKFAVQFVRIMNTEAKEASPLIPELKYLGISLLVVLVITFIMRLESPITMTIGIYGICIIYCMLVIITYMFGMCFATTERFVTETSDLWKYFAGYNVLFVVLLIINQWFVNKEYGGVDDESMIGYLMSCTGLAYLLHTAAVILFVVYYLWHMAPYRYIALAGVGICFVASLVLHCQAQKNTILGIPACIVQQMLSIVLLPIAAALVFFCFGKEVCNGMGEGLSSLSDRDIQRSFQSFDSAATAEKASCERANAQQAEKERRQRESYVLNKDSGEKYRMNSDLTKYYDHGEWKDVSDIK